MTGNIEVEARAEAEKRYAATDLCQDAQLGFVDGALWASGTAREETGNANTRDT